MTTPFAAACDAGPGLRTTPARHVSFAAPSLPEGQFAFARVKGNVCLVQLSYSTPAASSALAPLDVKIFRHEFITIFRFSHCDTVHPADISIIEPIDNHLARYEEENGTVFLAREIMDRLRKLTQSKVVTQKQRPSSIRYYASPRWRTPS